MTGICKICKQTVVSPVVGVDMNEVSLAFGAAMLDHMGKVHMDYMRELTVLTRVFSGFIVMNRFTIADEKMEEEKEHMRDEITTRVMEDAPYEDDDEDDDEGDDDSEEEGEYIKEPEEDVSPVFTRNIKRRGQKEQKAN